MKKQTPILENFFSWKGLPSFLTILGLILGLIVWVVGLDSRLGYIEKDHATFGAFYQKQIDDIKNSQLRVEKKLDDILILRK